MKRKKSPPELEARLAELERVLAWLADLDETTVGLVARGQALGEAGAAAREALARLGMGERVTSASRPVVALIPASSCDHAAHRPAFDSESACGLEADEIANRWPPYEGPCARCGSWVLLYASPTHEVLARW
jgi:hypothetical protein